MVYVHLLVVFFCVSQQQKAILKILKQTAFPSLLCKSKKYAANKWSWFKSAWRKQILGRSEITFSRSFWQVMPSFPPIHLNLWETLRHHQQQHHGQSRHGNLMDQPESEVSNDTRSPVDWLRFQRYCFPIPTRHHNSCKYTAFSVSRVVVQKPLQ